MVLILQIFYSIFSSVLLSLAIPNELYLLGAPAIAFVALIPYYYAIKNTNNYWTACLLGFIQAGTTHLLSSFWLAYFKDFAILTLGGSCLGTAIEGAYWAIIAYVPFADSKNRNPLAKHSVLTSSKICFDVFYFASVYTLYEWNKSISFLGYPWGTVSSSMFNFETFKQLAAITGTYGITYLTVIFNCLIVELYELTLCNPDFDILSMNPKTTSEKNRWFYYGKAASVFILLMTATLIYGFIENNRTRNPQKIITTIIVQQNSDSWKNETDDGTIMLSELLTEEQLKKLKTENKKADLILWSEGSLKYPFPSSLAHYKNSPTEKPFISFIKEHKIPVITGGSYKKDPVQHIYNNAALLFDENGNFRGYYGKNHLVPFAEVIPGFEIPKIKAIMNKIVKISAGWAPGDQWVMFEVPCRHSEKYKLPASRVIDLQVPYSKQLEAEKAKPTVKISAPICYDDAFPDVMRPMFLAGTEVFMNITDDSWSLKRSSEFQHFVVASFRAIEYRTTLVRSTNAGYSVVLDPTGKILADLPLFEPAALTYDVPVYEHKMTTYARFGNWVPFILAIFTILSVFYFYSNFETSDYIANARKLRKKNKKHNKKKKK